LRREQFEFLVDGKPQPIAFFERVAAGGGREAALFASARRGASLPPGATGDSASAAAAADQGRTAFFFVDDLHLSPDSMKRTRDLLLRYVDDVIGLKDQALIATASGQLGFLQQLAGDKAVLRAAIRQLTHRPHSAADNISHPAMNEYEAIAIERNDPDAVSYFVDLQCEEFKRMGRPCGGPTYGFSNNAALDEGF
jgi:hypothetical protein